MLSSSLWEVIEGAAGDVIFNLKCGNKPSPGNMTAVLAKEIVMKKNSVTESFEQFYVCLMSLLMPILSIDSKTVPARMAQCSNIHKVSENEDLSEKWDALLSHLKFNSISKNMLLQFIITKSYEKLLNERNKIVFEKEKEIVNVELSQEELKVLRYVAGFIPFSLWKKCKNKFGDSADVVRKMLNSWRANSD